MSFKKSRDQIYKIPEKLLLVILLLVGIGILVITFDKIYPGPLLNETSSTFIDSTKNISNIIAGALVASIIGLFSSVAIMDLDYQRNRDNIILGFYYEIMDLKEKISEIPVDNFQDCIGYFVIHKIKLYSENGLYFVLKKELFVLDKSILEKILEIYPKIIFVDSIIPNSGDRHASPELLKIHENIAEIKLKLDALLLILKNEVQKMEE
ncbi:hypothetical protein [Methanoregula sp.]|jgi:hypothetical protein|uniref:hypothetical protein n=1 Tax=Methanoregula sp. TaxID=2052170 RepID=UPI003C1B76E3